MQFQHLTVKDGLSQNTVLDIFQDNRGLLWFGTFNGLNVFYGRTINRIYSSDYQTGGLSNNHILVIYQDQADTMWIGTNGGGLNRLLKGSYQFTHYNNKNSDLKKLKSDIVYALIHSHSRLWVGTDNGLYCFNQAQD